jgi:RNA polymerase sigma-70 factor (ECF subfamily)
MISYIVYTFIHLFLTLGSLTLADYPHVGIAWGVSFRHTAPQGSGWVPRNLTGFETGKKMPPIPRGGKMFQDIMTEHSQTTREMNIDLDRLCSGDKRSWDAFVEANARVIYWTAASVLRKRNPRASEDAVRDVAQEVFLKLVQHDYRLLRSFDPAKSSLRTWLAVVARSTTLDHLRKEARATRDLIEAELEEIPAEPEASESCPDIPFEALSSRQRMVLRMLYELDMDVRDVAKNLEITEQTVRSIRHQALARVRAHMLRGEA